jgi:drug/metabolite transporter (DMT)-like permease
MFGIALAALSNVFEEITDSIGKKEVRDRAASLYTFGFLGLLFGTIFLVVEGLMRHSLHFSLGSLPTFVPRVALEILQAYVTVRAITLADRGDFGFVRTLTMPLLLGIDIALGYSITTTQIVGIGLIFLPIAVLLAVELREMKGLRYLVIGAVNAAATISLYKYDITHFNSVEAEQAIVGTVLMLYFFALARTTSHENPLHFLRVRAFAGLTIASGLSNIVASFAYIFAPASVILAALRSSAVLFALLSGRYYFREQHFAVRVSLFVFTLAGLILLIPR